MLPYLVRIFIIFLILRANCMDVATLWDNNNNNNNNRSNWLAANVFLSFSCKLFFIFVLFPL